MDRIERDFQACRVELEMMGAATRNGLAEIRAKHQRVPSDGASMFREMAVFTDSQLGLIEFAERTWVTPHSLKAKSAHMAPMKEHLAHVRQQVIAVALVA